jgi:hypothetical protein
MKADLSRDTPVFPFKERRAIMNALHRITVASLLAIAMVVAPAAAMAGPGNSDNDSGKRHLIDRQHIRDLIEDLKEKDHRGSGNGNAAIQTMQGQLTALQNQVTGLMSSNASLLAQVQAAVSQIALLQSQVTTLQSNSGGGSGLASLAQYVTVDPSTINGLPGPHVIFTGVNVHIRSGSGFTDNSLAANSGSFNGLGNLVVGYNEIPTPPVTATRTGSHNLVGGWANSFLSFGGLVFGRQNTITGKFATITGGYKNEADGDSSSILGGQSMTVTGFATHNP